MSDRMSGWKKRQLILDLAKGDLSHEQLAEKYDRHVTTIRANAKRWAEEIAAVRKDSADLYAGMWSAEKALRIATWQQDVEEIDEVLAKAIESDEDLIPYAGLLRMKQTALVHIAEELGQLPTRTTVQVDDVKVVYRIEGIDPSDAV